MAILNKILKNIYLYELFTFICPILFFLMKMQNIFWRKLHQFHLNLFF